MITAGLALLLLALLPALLRKPLLFSIVSTFASLVLLVGYAQLLFGGQAVLYTLSLPTITGSVSLGVSPLSAFFGLIFALGFSLGLPYSHAYLQAHPGKGVVSHQFFLGLMLISMHLVLLAQSSVLFMFAWELMSLGSFFAIINDRGSRETVSAALYYFVMMQVGAVFLLAGFALQYLDTGSFAIWGEDFGGWTKWLLLIGFAFKAGFFPFYSWLPKAHPVAPAHLSGMMSGMMIKTGIFGIVLVLSHSSWGFGELTVLLAIALITAFNGIVHSLAESNIKRALAYSSIENIGIIGVGLVFWQLGTLLGYPVMSALGLTGALLHCLNHSLFKPMLFYLSGNVLVGAHSLEMDELGGLAGKMPYTGVLFLGGTLAISALPLFNGFISELGIFLAVVNGFDAGNLGTVLASVAGGTCLAMVSALALIAFVKVFSIVFQGAPRSKHAAQAREVKAGMLVSPALLALLCLILGIFGRIGLLTVLPLTETFHLSKTVLTGFGNTLDGITLVSLMLLVLFAALYLTKRLLGKHRMASTWGCGYAKPSPRMQYTGSAFINPLSYFLKPLLSRSADKHIVQGYFPGKLEYQEEVQDYVDKGAISFISKLRKWVFAPFEGIHNGKANSYISYLLAVLLLIIIWVLGAGK